MNHFGDPRNILITGASSGIGAALALAYAGPETTLALMGRNPRRLEATADACRLSGAQVYSTCLDVRDPEPLEKWILDFDASHPVDLVIANAGISASLGEQGESQPREEVRAILDTNINGVLNTVTPLIEPMRRRKRGQIALMSSLAAYYGLPSLAAYCAGKAAVKAYGESLRGWLKGDGLGVSVICPGFVQSPVTDRVLGPTPFCVTTGRAIAIIKKGLARNRGRIAFPMLLAVGSALLTLLPSWVGDIFIEMFDFKIGADSSGEK